MDNRLYCIYILGAKYPEIVFKTNSLEEARKNLNIRQNCEHCYVNVFPRDWSRASILREEVFAHDYRRLISKVTIVKKINTPEEFLDYCREQKIPVFDLLVGRLYKGDSSVKVSIIFNTPTEAELAKILERFIVSQERRLKYGFEN